jgi:hypothetical protein
MNPKPITEFAFSINEQPQTTIAEAEVNAQLLGVKKPKKEKAPKVAKDLNFVVTVNDAEVVKTLDIFQAEEAVKTAKKAKQLPVVTKGAKLIGLTSFSSMCSVARRKLK